jgi:7-cyano-7-deazaguanine synthase
VTHRAVAIVSGGMDSVTLAHLLALEYDALTLVSIDYGQRHAKELHFAAQAAVRLEARHHIVNMTSITELLTGSALTDPTVPVPHGHYEEPTMRATVVPNRNATMLCVAVAIAVAEGAEVVATGVHAGDHAVYPDCRPEFIDAFARMAEVANEGFLAPGFSVLAPFVHQSKADIARLGDKIGVPWAATWSCYEGGEVHCGRCGTCVERIEAFQLAGVNDPTRYAA